MRRKGIGLAQFAACLATIICGPIHYAQEKHLTNVTQLTFGGINAEAYFSFDGKQILFQATNPAHGTADCDQIFRLRLDDPNAVPEMVSSGRGRTTCSFFFPNDSRFIYSTTEAYQQDCPAVVCRQPNAPDECKRHGVYLWDVFPSYEIVLSDGNGSLKFLTKNKAYDAEGVVSPDGSRILFTSDRGGDLDLYTMDADGNDVRQLTNTLGYDGGAFFSADGEKIVFRAYHPTDNESIATYKRLLSRNVVSPSRMEIFTMNANGTNAKQVTNLGRANWAPFFHPNGKQIIFSSNHHSPATFNLFLVDESGHHLERITYDPHFDSFPMFSPDGKKLIFISARNNVGDARNHTMNIFIADWLPNAAWRPLALNAGMWLLFAYLAFTIHN